MGAGLTTVGGPVVALASTALISWAAGLAETKLALTKPSLPSESLIFHQSPFLPIIVNSWLAFSKTIISASVPAPARTLAPSVISERIFPPGVAEGSALAMKVAVIVLVAAGPSG